MPQAAGVLVAAVIGGYTIAEFAAVVVLTFILNGIAKSLEPKQKKPLVRLPTLEAQYSSAETPVQFIYGEVRAGGMDLIPPGVAPLRNDELVRALVLSVGRIEQIGDVYMNDEDVIPYSYFGATTPANPNSATIGINGGAVNTGKYGPTADIPQGSMHVRRYMGTSSQSYDPRFAFYINSADMRTFKGNGFAWAACDFRFNADLYKNLPQINFVVKGIWCYDPRKDSTNGGSGSHRYTDDTTWEYSNNPALCLAHYLCHRFGGNFDPAREIYWPDVITAANACDVTVYTPNGTAKRYTCNGILVAARKPEEFIENLNFLTQSMLGKLSYTNCVWRMQAGTWQAPTFTINKSDWVSPPSTMLEGGVTKRFNRLFTWYNASSSHYQRTSTTRVNTTYRAADNGKDISREIDLPMCVDYYEAQRKNEMLLRQSRNQVLISGQLPPRFSDLGMFDTVTIVDSEVGWTSKTFRTVSNAINADASYTAAFQEEQSSDWTDIGTSDYQATSDTPLPLLNDSTPSEPRNFTVAPQINGTLLFDWQRPTVDPVGLEYRLVQSTNSCDASVGTTVWRGNATRVPLVMPTSRHWYYVYSIVGSIASPFQPNTYGVSAGAGPEATQHYARLPIQDPDIEFSAEQGEYWIPTSGQSAVWSLSLAGGNVGGKIVLTVNSPNTTYIMYAYGKTPYAKLNAGVVHSDIRARVTSYATGSYGYPHAAAFLNVQLYGWTGADTPSAGNVQVGVVPVPFYVSSVGAPGFGVSSTEWRQKSLVSSLATEHSAPGVGNINPSSYPYAAARLIFDSGPTFTGVIEIDRAAIDIV